MMLMEALMAIAIFAIGMEGVNLLFLRTWTSNKYTLEMGQSSMAVSQGVNMMTDYIRGARQADNGSYPVKSASDNDLVLYSDYDKDNKTERLHFYKNNQQVLMGVTEPTDAMPRTYPVGDQQIITIAESIVNDNATPIFKYYDKNFAGNETTNPPLSSPVNIVNVRLIKIHLQINIDPNRAPDNIQMQTFAELRNLNDYNKMQ